MHYQIARNPRPHARPRFFLRPVTAEPVMPAGKERDALQAQEATSVRRQGSLHDVRDADASRRPQEPAIAYEAGAQGGRFGA